MMKRSVLIPLFAITLLALQTRVQGQDCSAWNEWHLAGTYTMTGNGYSDLSKVLPGMGVPAGSLPMFWLGAMTLDGRGGGGGWVSINWAGIQFSNQLTDLKYAVQADCSVRMSFSMKSKELGVSIPAQRLLVLVPKPAGLELHMIMAGASPGKPPDPRLDSGVAHRISVQY